MSVTKPTQDPLFDTNDTNTWDPGAAIRLDGYPFNAELPSNEGNWLFRSLGDWVTYLNRNSTFDTVAAGIQGALAGDVFAVSGDFPAGLSVDEANVAAGGAALPGFLDTDGDYFAWVTQDDFNKIRLSRFDDASILVITVPAAETVTSLAMDGYRIVVTTSANNVRGCDYSGTWTQLKAQTGTILDIGFGHVLLAETATTFRLLDAHSVVFTSISTGATGVIAFGRIAPYAVDTVILAHWNAGLDIDLWTAGVQTWNHTAGSLGTGWLMLALDGMFIHLVADAVGGDDLITIPLTNQVPVGERIITMASDNNSYLATPHFIVAYHPTTSTDLRFIGWDGVELGRTSTLGGDVLNGPMVCDGMDPIYIQHDAGGGGFHRVCRYPVGNRGMNMRRYASTDWRPYCHSQAVACGRVNIG